ncbi:hypothetical protein LTR49_007827 [Elasticomyces elasticus]|nr:hypothetical protein LTR49_007827 [Elasticomyces elasticus]
MYRNFRALQTISFASGIIGTWEILLAASGPGLQNGGLAGVMYSTLWTVRNSIGYIGQLFVSLSLAELASMAPTSAAHWHWQSVNAAYCYIIAGSIQELIQLNNPGYVQKNWHMTLLIITATLVASFIRILYSNHLSLLEGIYCVLHVYALVPLALTLWVLAPDGSWKGVFTNFHNGGGWPSTWLSVFAGQTTSIFVWLGSDSVAHLSEEVQDAAHILPPAIVAGYLINGPLGFALAVTIGFCYPNIETAPQTTWPYIWLFHKALEDPAVMTAFICVVLCLLAMKALSVRAVNTRVTLALARDHALPFSQWLRQGDSRLKSPIVSGISTVLLSLLTLCGSVKMAFQSVLCLANAALTGTYVVCVACILLKRVRKQPLPYAYWSLGRAGLAVNSLGLGYSVCEL